MTLSTSAKKARWMVNFGKQVWPCSNRREVATVLRKAIAEHVPFHSVSLAHIDEQAVSDLVGAHAARSRPQLHKLLVAYGIGIHKMSKKTRFE
jgi:hypothetical protein